jgi:TPR repeat protein
LLSVCSSSLALLQGCTPPAPPRLNYDTNKACTSSAGHGEPLVVDWQPGQRVDLEAAMRDGVALVHYDCKTLKLVKGCRIDGGYGFMATTTKEEVVRLVNADEVRANLPLSGPRLGAELGADFQRGATLDIALVMIGKKATTWRSVRSNDLRGEGCNDATHFIASASIGAFVMQTGEESSAKTAVELFNAGGGVSSKKFKHIRNTDGLIDECKKASPDSNTPPQQCGAPLRLELIPIADKVQRPATDPGKDSKNAGLDSAETTPAPSCPEGFAVSGGKCVRASQGAVFACKGDNMKECEQQCAKNEPNSCHRLALAHRLGQGVNKDPGLTRTLFKKACEGGLATACTDLGVALEHGLGGPKDVDGAYAIYKKACENGEPVGCSWLGTLYTKGLGVEQNINKAARLYENGCNGGHAAGCTFLGLFHTDGRGVAKDDSRAVQLFERACRGDNGQACMLLASRYDEGKGVERDDLQAFKLYVQGCNAGFGASCTQLADRYLQGKGIPPEGRQGNPAENALNLYEKGCLANSSDPNGCHKLGQAFLQGKIAPKNVDNANKLFTLGCEGGSGLACQSLSYNVYLGQGTKADKKGALGLMQRGCELGVGSACMQLGRWVHRGEGTTSDHKLAASLWDKGCSLKDTDSCLALGYAFEFGDGVPKKPDVAAELYKRSCTDTDVTGCLNLGVLYYFGTGVSRDHSKAFKLFQFGCSKGDKKSCLNSAIMQMNGEGTDKSEEKAVEVFRELCENQSYFSACGTLGYLAKYGKGFAKDPARAKSYSERACDGGDLVGCVNLAVWIDETPAAKKEELDRAFSLLQRACDGGERSGCAYLGYMYERGRGTPKDPKRAVSLFRRACDDGYPMGCSSLEFVQELGTSGVPASPLLAATQFEGQCKKKDNKDARACAQAGFQYLLGRGVKQDRSRAIGLLRQACLLEDRRSCEQLRLMAETQK